MLYSRNSEKKEKEIIGKGRNSRGGQRWNFRGGRCGRYFGGMGIVCGAWNDIVRWMVRRGARCRDCRAQQDFLISLWWCVCGVGFCASSGWCTGSFHCSRVTWRPQIPSCLRGSRSPYGGHLMLTCSLTWTFLIAPSFLFFFPFFFCEFYFFSGAFFFFLKFFFFFFVSGALNKYMCPEFGCASACYYWLPNYYCRETRI